MRRLASTSNLEVPAWPGVNGDRIRKEIIIIYKIEPPSLMTKVKPSDKRMNLEETPGGHSEKRQWEMCFIEWWEMSICKEKFRYSTVSGNLGRRFCGLIGKAGGRLSEIDEISVIPPTILSPGANFAQLRAFP